MNPLTEDLEYWFQAPTNELQLLFQEARKIADRSFGRQVSFFVPGSKFPSVSVTGSKCELQCQHCNAHFLEHMHPITQPKELFSFCEQLDNKGAVGCLISGGCDVEGRVPLIPYYSVLKKIKQTTNLFLNVHTGFLTYSEAKGLADTGIDCASVDVIGEETTLHQIYGLTTRSISDYATTLEALASTKLAIAPHICVGINYGRLTGELAALKLIQSILQPNIIVIIAFMPTQGTSMSDVPPPTSYDVARVCALARMIFPSCEIALGCMRPRGILRQEMERLAVEAGITRLVLPTKATVEYLQENQYTYNIEAACCVIPLPNRTSVQR